MSKFASPPIHAASTESGTMSDTFDDASTVFDDTGSLGPFLLVLLKLDRKNLSKTLLMLLLFLKLLLLKKLFLKKVILNLMMNFMEII